MYCGCQGLNDVSPYKPVPIALAKSKQRKLICPVDAHHKDLGLNEDQTVNFVEKQLNNLDVEIQQSYLGRSVKDKKLQLSFVN